MSGCEWWDCERDGHVVGDDVFCFECGERVISEEQVAQASEEWARKRLERQLRVAEIRAAMARDDLPPAEGLAAARALLAAELKRSGVSARA